MKKLTSGGLLLLVILAISPIIKAQTLPTKQEAIKVLRLVNHYWQTNNPVLGSFFWDNAAYHVGNMEAYKVTKDEKYLLYTQLWAEQNAWEGAKGTNKSKWKYTYGEGGDFALFGDNQICFQVYADLYQIKKDPKRIARAREVMEYQMSTNVNDYWWWADGLFMVMPVMTKYYHITKNELYLRKLYDYFQHANNIMYDANENLYYRDAKYVYPKHKSVNGKKDFWARGDGWVFAALSRVIQDLPKKNVMLPFYVKRYQDMAKAIATCQQPEGYWTRSMLDKEHAPGPETSGTAFFTYGFIWGINHGYLDEATYLPVVAKAWSYLTTVAMQSDGKLGYVQPIGERAIPGQTVDINSQANFGVGAFLLAASEMSRYKKK